MTSTHIDCHNGEEAIGKEHVTAVQPIGQAEGGERVVGDGDGAGVEPHSLASSMDEAQIGVKGIEAVSMTWTKWGLTVAYLG